MGVLYILVSLVVIFMNIKIFPSVIANIFRDAFNFKAAFSGFARFVHHVGHQARPVLQ